MFSGKGQPKAIDKDDAPAWAVAVPGGDPLVVVQPRRKPPEVFRLTRALKLVPDAPPGWTPHVHARDRYSVVLGSGVKGAWLLGAQGIHQRTSKGWSKRIPWTAPVDRFDKPMAPRGITSDGQGRPIIYGLHRKLPQRYEGGVWKDLDLEPFGCSNWWRRHGVAPDGRLGVATEAGICILDPKGDHPVNVPFDTWGHYPRAVSSVAFTTRGDLIAGKDHLLGFYADGRWVRHATTVGLPCTTATHVLSDTKGRTWVSSWGLCVTDKDLSTLPSIETIYRRKAALPLWSKDTKVVDKERVEINGNLYKVRRMAKNWEGIAHNNATDGRLHDAVSTLARVAQAWRQVGHASNEARALASIAAVADDAGEPEFALELIEKALGALKNIFAPEVEAGLLLYRAQLYRRLGRPFDATADARRARILSKESGATAIAANVDYVLGLAALDVGELEEAEARLEQAVRGFRGQGSTGSAAQALAALGQLALLVGDLDGAYLKLNRALQDARNAEDTIDEAETLGLLAAVEARRGRYQQAIGRIDGALMVLPESLRATRVRLLLTKAQMAIEFGDPEAARPALAEAEHQARGIQTGPHAAELALAGARVALKLGERAEAKKQAELALSRAESVNAALTQLDAHLLLAELDPEDREHALAADRLAGRFKVPRVKVRTALAEAERLLRAKAAERATKRLEKALAEIPADDNELRAQTLALLASTLEAQGETAAAARRSTEAVAALESMRRWVVEDRAATWFLKDREAVYDGAVRLLASTGDAAGALRVAEQARARAFATSISHSSGAEEGGEEGGGDRVAQAGERNARARLLARLSRVQAALQAAEATRRASLDPAGALASLASAHGPVRVRRSDTPHVSSRLTALQSEYDKLLAQLADLDGAAARRLTAEVPPTEGLVAAVGDSADKGAVYVGYHLQPRAPSHAFVVREGEIEVVELPISGPEAQRLVAELRRELDSERASAGSTRWRRPAKALWRALVAPLEGELGGARTILVAPHRSLHYAPLAALTEDGKRYFGDLAPLVLVPSLTAFARLSARPSAASPDGAPAVLADPRVDYAAVDPLPSARREGELVAELLGPKAQRLQGKEATEAALRKASRAPILHVAAHGELNPAAPSFSRLLLAAGEGHDGALHLHELGQLELAARLVVLSACETGLATGAGGVPAAGDELVGLTRGFLEAGADAVIASLWSVGDQSTRELMRLLYRELAAGASPGLALQRAQTTLRVRHPHPWHWASFNVFGAPR